MIGTVAQFAVPNSPSRQAPATQRPHPVAPTHGAYGAAIKQAHAGAGMKAPAC